MKPNLDHNKTSKKKMNVIINSVTCQPMPRPRTEGGIIVALAYLDTAIKVPVD
jgi:hypothetical protein